jgi:O-acetyl-ADP-ribose deacetylase (regulator of RNase III)
MASPADIKVRFHLTIGDITHLKVDAIVNAAKYFVARRRG